jgi:hypothetical protein
MVTILYYSSNREDIQFESQIIDNILNNSNGLPIVSVTQKPMDLGKNICVGEHGSSYYNEFKQIQIGLEAIDTEWVLVAESDVLYPPEYFKFVPPDDFIVYRYHPVYIHFEKRPIKFYYKGFSDGAQMMNRKKWLELISRFVKDEWDYQGKFRTPWVVPDTVDEKSWSGSPAISFKTRKGVSYATGLKEGKVEELPYWGTFKQIKEKYLWNI